MPVTIEITQGPLKGSEFQLSAGMQIGRSGADVNFKDPKISSVHAEVHKSTTANNLVLFDLKSTNGIKVDGKKVSSVDLLLGATVQIGHTVFKVTAVDDSEESALELSDWRTHLLRVVSKIKPAPKTQTDIRHFRDPITLEFLEGPQKGDKFILGYGPRIIGKDAFDLGFQDPAIRDLSFELVPTSDGRIEFRTKNSKEILFNGLSKAVETIKTGDHLNIGQTLIEINFGNS